MNTTYSNNTICTHCNQRFDAHKENGPCALFAPRAAHRQSPKQAAYLFFLKHAGYSMAQGETQRAGRSRSARELAKAERDAAALGFTFEWTDDWSCNHEKEFSYTPHACESCVCYDGDSNVVASLGCIDDATREYRRMVEAELAMEALAEVSR